MSAIEKSNVIPFSLPPARHEEVAPCVLAYKGAHRPFYDTVATQGASYLRYVEQRCRDDLANHAELSAPHNLTVCALVAIANKLQFDDELEVGNQLFRLIGDMFQIQESSDRQNIMVAQISADAVDFIQFHAVPNKYHSFEYPSQLNEIFDFS